MDLLRGGKTVGEEPQLAHHCDDGRALRFMLEVGVNYSAPTLNISSSVLAFSAIKLVKQVAK